MNLTTRINKGSPITWAEMDQNMKLFLPEIYKYVDMESVLLAATNMIDGDWVYATDTDKCGRYFNGAIKWFTTKNFRPFFNNLAQNMQGQIDINFTSPIHNGCFNIKNDEIIMVQDKGKYQSVPNISYRYNILTDNLITQQFNGNSGYYENDTYIYTLEFNYYPSQLFWISKYLKGVGSEITLVGKIDITSLRNNYNVILTVYNNDIYMIHSLNGIKKFNFTNQTIVNISTISNIINMPVFSSNNYLDQGSGANGFDYAEANYVSANDGIYKLSFDGVTATFTLVVLATNPIFDNYKNKLNSSDTGPDVLAYGNEGRASTETHTYFFNGSNTNTYYPKNLSYKIKLSDNTITKLPNSSHLNVPCSADYNSTDGFIYIGGGFEDGWWDVPSQRVQIFDPINEIWLDQI